MKDFKVSVPATTANLGPGLDCLGMAIDLWNRVEVRAGGSGIKICGEGKEILGNDKSNLVYVGFRIAHETIGMPLTPVGMTCENSIPLSRGLGSSAAAIVSGLIAGNLVCGEKLTTEDILKLATKIEGHPDNVAPAMLGGCQIVVSDDDHLITSTVPIPTTLHAVMFIPDSPVPTREGRAVLGGAVARVDAVYNLGRVALLINTLQNNDLSHLDAATKDRLHQPARQRVFPAMKNIMDAARDAGAMGVFLSGSGSTILALASTKELTIGYEMADAASKSGVDGTIKIAPPTNIGAHVDFV